MARSAPRSDAGAKSDARQRVRIGRYRIVSRLGRGGMGMVYRGLDETLEREVAVKILTAEGTFEEENRQRFEIEAKAAARLQHPNIVTVYELGEDRGVPFIAMELLPGGDLEGLLRSGESLTLSERLEIVVQVCRGLAFAHEHKIVHRDVKPSNIRLLDDGTVKIMDFGIAKLGSTNVTKVGMMVGTMNYMSPEQIRGQALDGRSDVFSVGVILFQLLAGRRPFVGKGGPDVLYRIIQDETPPLGVDLGPDTPRLQEIVNRSLEKDPQGRYASADQLADDLERLLQTLHERSKAPALAPAEQEAVSGARRSLKDGRLEDAQRRLEPILARWASAPEVLRLARALRRELQRRAQPAAAGDEFPELEATYRANVTERTPDTFVGRTPETGAGPARWLIPVAVALVLSAVAASVLLLRGRKEPTKTAQEQPRPVATPIAAPPPEPSPSASAPRPVALRKLAIESDPAGAKLAPAEPPGSLAVLSSYPVDVFWKGKPLAKAQLSPRLSLPPGRHTLSILAPSHFLKRDVAVEIKSGGTQGIEVPGLGKISIKANPDNCEVSIDGAFVDYPPILDRAIVEGSHTVAFKWPDGLKREATVEVGKGRVAYVMGRRE